MPCSPPCRGCLNYNKDHFSTPWFKVEWVGPVLVWHSTLELHEFSAVLQASKFCVTRSITLGRSVPEASAANQPGGPAPRGQEETWRLVVRMSPGPRCVCCERQHLVKAPPVEIVLHPNPETCRGHRSAVQLLGCFKAVLVGNFLMIKKIPNPTKTALNPKCSVFSKMPQVM